MAPVTTDDQDVLEALKHERLIDLYKEKKNLNHYESWCIVPCRDSIELRMCL
jgi:hypothetical protein